MKKRWNILSLLCALLLTFGIIESVLAFQPPHRVARLSVVHGDLTISPMGKKVRCGSRPNRPLMAGDRVWSGNHSRAELQLDQATAFLGPQTHLTLLNLDHDWVQFKLSAGQFCLFIPGMMEHQVYEINTPNATLMIQKPGFYKVIIDQAGRATLINIKHGRAQALGNGIAYKLHAGKSYRFTGTKLKAQTIILRDGAFDYWCQNRLNRTFGYDVPEHGMVWIPDTARVPVYAPVPPSTVIQVYSKPKIKKVYTHQGPHRGRAVPQKVFVPAPIHKPLSAPKPKVMPQPMPMPAPQPMAVPAPEPMAMPAPEPMAVPAPEPMAVPAPEPMAMPEPMPVSEPEPLEQPTDVE